VLEAFLLLLALVAGYLAGDALLASRATGAVIHEIEALILLLIAAVLLTGACLVGKLNVLQRLLQSGEPEDRPAWWNRRKH
jgi:hypothetical protein